MRRGRIADGISFANPKSATTSRSANHHVIGFDIAMNDASGMCRRQGRRDLNGDVIRRAVPIEADRPARFAIHAPPR
jgi:hypothetical protein